MCVYVFETGWQNILFVIWERERERESSLLNHNLLIFSQWSCSWSPACIAYACTFCKPTAVTYRTEAGAGLSCYSCISPQGEGRDEGGDVLLPSTVLRPVSQAPGIRSCLLSLGSHAWSPSVSADSRDERDGAGRVLGHWALYADGRPWQGCFHASTPSRQPSERLILSFLCVFPLPFLLPPLFTSVLPFLTLQPTFHCCLCIKQICPLTR